MGLKLGEAMVKEGLITNDMLAKALERQIIFGGRLGTNLVEMGSISEETLAKFLSKVLGVPYVGPEVFENLPQEVLDSFPSELAQKYTALPIKKERSRLHVVMKDPNDFAVLEELRFILGVDIKPYISSEIRIVFALEKYYGIKRDLRYITILDHEGEEKLKDMVVEETPSAQGKGFEKYFQPPPPVKEVPEAAPEAPAAPPAKPPVGPPAAAPAPPPAAAAPRPEAPRPAPAPASVPAAAPPPMVEEGPYEALANPRDRDHIADAIVRAAAHELKRVVLFLVKGRSVTSWKSSGAGLDQGRAAGLDMGLDGPSIFKDVVEDRRGYKGPILRVPQNVQLVEALGGGYPQEAVAYPLIIKDKVVAVLYGDNGGDALITGDVDRLGTLMVKGAMSLEILILKNKILN